MGKNWLTICFVIIGLVAAGLAYYLYEQINEAGDMWPAENASGSLTSAVASLNNEVNALRLEKAKIPAASENLTAVTVDYELAARVLPRESSPDQLIAAIRTKAQQSGVSPSQLTPSIVRASGGRRGGGGSFETWRFSLTIEGSYDQIATFVNRMEEFDSTDAARTGSEKRFFEVQEINIISQGNGLVNLGHVATNKPIMHKCDMVMQTYRYTGD